MGDFYGIFHKMFVLPIPITAMCVLEDSSKSTNGFTVISRTYDEDTDADLWKGSTFFGGKISRYLGYSKKEAFGDYVVECLKVIGEKDQPPDGYCVISRTIDTDVKAWKKRQICYKLTRRKLADTAVTDVILMSKGNVAPKDFEYVGSVNGLAVCIKKETMEYDKMLSLVNVDRSTYDPGDFVPPPTTSKNNGKARPHDQPQQQECEHFELAGSNNNSKIIQPQHQESKHFELAGSNNNSKIIQPQQQESEHFELAGSNNNSKIIQPQLQPQQQSNWVLYPMVPNRNIKSPDKTLTASASDEYVNLLVPKRRAPPIPSPLGKVSNATTSTTALPPSPVSHQSGATPPPRPPQPLYSNTYGTLSQHHGLEGIPFVLHPSLQLLREKGTLFQMPQVKFKTKEEIDKEYYYDFRLERQST